MVCKWLAVLHMLAMAAAHAHKQDRLCKWVNCVAMVCSAHTWLGLHKEDAVFAYSRMRLWNATHVRHMCAHLHCKLCRADCMLSLESQFNAHAEPLQS